METTGLLPRHHNGGTTSQQQISNSKSRRRQRPRFSTRTKPPSQDRLIIVFITATGIFFLISISPFLLGHFPAHGTDDKGWMHKHGDGQGGVLNLAENKTLLAWHYLMGQRQQQQLAEEKNSIHQSGYGKKRDEDESLPLARGVSGLPSSQTPALVGAQHGSIQCPSKNGGTIQIDELAYWNEPQGDSDLSFISPFAPSNDQSKERRYITFEPDRGGWNNIRMSLEIVIVFAAATGRTLVLPPDTPFYLLTKKQEGTKSKQHGFADFLDLDNTALRNKVNMITMNQFLEIEGKNHGDSRIVDEKMFTIPGGEVGKKIWKAADHCLYVAKSDRPCDSIYDFLRSQAYVPELQAGRDCLIFDLDRQQAKEEYTDPELFDLMPESEQQKVKQFCDRRTPIFFGNELASAPLIHFHSGVKTHRLLNHFYTFLFFTDAKIDQYFKRFVRDYLHYTDNIWCAAGRVLHELEEEATKYATNGEPIEFSALHVRRGDFQYKKVKITAEDWYDNTKDLFHPNEIIYVATDEKNKTFFEPLAKRYNLRFLSDFSDAAGLNELDPNLLGMIDTIVASRGRLFVGTWFSTFTGYINRMRGYYGMSGTTSYYSTTERKFNTHKWENPNKVMTAREWPTAWIGIDGDEIVSEERKSHI